MANRSSGKSLIERICGIFNASGKPSVMPYESEGDLPQLWVESSAGGTRVVSAGLSGDTLESEVQLLIRCRSVSAQDRLDASARLESLVAEAMSVGQADGVEITDFGATFEREGSEESGTAVLGVKFTVRHDSRASMDGAMSLTISRGEEVLSISRDGLLRLTQDGLSGFDSPEIKVSFLENALHNGSHLGENRFGTRFLGVSFEITDRNELSQVRDVILRMSDPNAELEIRTSLYGRERVIKARTYKAPELVLGGTRDLPRVRLSLAAEQPFFLDTRERIVQLPSEEPLCTFPLTLMKDGGATMSFCDAAGNPYTVVNEGDVAIGFEMVIDAVRGDVMKPMMQLGSRRFTFGERLGKGNRLTVDTRYGQKKVRVDSFNYYSFPRGSSFFELETGVNYLYVEAEEGQENMEAFIRYTPAYLGA